MRSFLLIIVALLLWPVAALAQDAVLIDPAVFESVSKALIEAYHMGGWLMLAVTAIIGTVNGYQLPWVQNLLARVSPYLTWEKWPKWARLLFVFVGSLAGFILPAVVAGKITLALVLSAVGSAIVAALTHKFVLNPLAKSSAGIAVASALPSAISRPLSLVVPFKAEDLSKARAMREAQAAGK